ncbi:MAG TPA: SDR family oxidoreductase [Gammaproteobacteria bacterium]|nr:SDR family oxidoreductase [Gammaproteobacteria bacterium]
MDLGLKGQRVLITGGGTGLGEGIAKYLAKMGAHVILCSRNLDRLTKVSKEIQSAGGQAEVYACNLRDPQSIQEMVDAIMQKPLFALVNNAAANFVSRTQDLSPNGFHAIFDTVAVGTFLVTQLIGKAWLDAKQPGRVVSITATYSEGAGPHVVPSAMGKAAVAAMTRSLAVEWGKDNIRLNAIAPGMIPTTGAWNNLFAAVAGDSSNLSMDQWIPQGRFGQPEELAKAVAFLISDECSSYINGQELYLDGGMHLASGAGAFYDIFRKFTPEQWKAIKAFGQHNKGAQ